MLPRLPPELPSRLQTSLISAAGVAAGCKDGSDGGCQPRWVDAAARIGDSHGVSSHDDVRWIGDATGVVDRRSEFENLLRIEHEVERNGVG